MATPRPPRLVPACIGWEIHSVSPIGSNTGVFITGAASAPGTPDDAAVSAVAGALRDWVNSATLGPASILPPSTLVDYVRAWSMEVVGGPEATIATAVLGTASGEPESYALAAQIIENTDEHRRNAFGRIYWGPLFKGAIDITTGLLDPTSQATIIGKIQNMLTALGTAGFPWCVASATHHRKLTIVALTIKFVVAIQDRRGRGRD